MPAVLPALRSLGVAALDVCYPRICAGCGGGLGEEAHQLCWDCRATLQFIQPPCCQRCGSPVAGRVDHAFTCQQCGTHPPVFDRALAAARYDGVMRDLIHQLKYQNAVWLLPDLSRFLEAVLQQPYPGEEVDAVVPVPLHPSRARQRGFNQAGSLARRVSKTLGVPCHPQLLQRLRPTPSQTRFSAAARRENVRGAFRIRRRISSSLPESVLLVDDVLTTGATVSECARVLKKAGVQKVFVLTLAHG